MKTTSKNIWLQIKNAASESARHPESARVSINGVHFLPRALGLQKHFEGEHPLTALLLWSKAVHVWCHQGQREKKNFLTETTRAAADIINKA